MTGTAGPAPLPEAGAAAGPDVVRVRLDLAYDGSGFSGWARQPGRRTVEGALREALGRVTGDPDLGLSVAGRTDAGVHARGQVAHVDLPVPAWDRLGRSRPGEVPADADADGATGRAAARLAHALRGLLPDDVAVLAAARAPDGFDARFSALSRTYAYRLDDRPGGPDVLRRGWVVAARAPLDVDAGQVAAEALVGEHDFGSFCRPRPGAGSVRRVLALQVVRPAGGPDAGLVVVEVTADAFCHSMVRAVVGALVEVGSGRRDAGWVRLLRDRPSRGHAPPTAPAHGLVLESVGYPDRDGLAARAVSLRAVGGPRERRRCGVADGVPPTEP